MSPRAAGAARAAAVALSLALAVALLPPETQRLRAGVGGYAVMNCHLDFPFGNEIPYNLHWDKDGETIFSWYSGDAAPRAVDRWAGRVQLARAAPALGRAALNLSAVRDTDAGLYRCRVTFPNRTPPARNNGTFYYLDVDGDNLITLPPVNVTVLEGERAELECLPKDFNWEVQWFKDDVSLESIPSLAGRAERPANGSLVLRRADSADLGLYSCSVRAPHALHSAAAYLDVHYKAKVVYAPQERFLPYGKPASLDCHFSANPPLTNLRWEKDGFLFDPYNVPGVFYSRNGSLLFNQVDESHEGDYSCTPYNALGTEGPSPRVRVRVLRPPVLAVRPAPQYLARVGGAVTLPCKAVPDNGGATPDLVWTRTDGAEPPTGRHSLDGGNLTIVDVVDEDRGEYRCTASNEAAAISVETELIIENVPPRAPQNLTSRSGAHSLHVAWLPGHSVVEVDYTLWYRERGDNDWRTMKILQRGVTEVTVTGLRSGVEYEVRVLAHDHIGDGLLSRPLYARTLDSDIEDDGESAAAAAAGVGVAAAADSEESQDDLNVNVRLLDDGALVRWQRAPGDSGPCTVRWFREGRPLHAEHSMHDYALVRELEEGAQYSARVRCAGGAGGAALRVPRWARLRGAAAGAAGAALLLAAAAAALLYRRRAVKA